jgi:hypothetical protein
LDDHAIGMASTLDITQLIRQPARLCSFLARAARCAARYRRAHGTQTVFGRLRLSCC